MVVKDKNDIVSIPEIIAFIKQKDYKFIKKLGHGSFGITILMEDETINEKFVCKKYSPQFGINVEKYYKNFINEIKLLYKLNHNNIVRVFNYHMFQERHTGFLIMEYIDGYNITSFLAEHPEMINDVFEQTVNGFAYLESQNILHRDIRPNNILVDNGGFVKIIDFGFGKQITFPEDFDRSFSSLNWWCELPLDFNSKIYNFKTEIYFVGKLFEKIILENYITRFEYDSILTKMCYNDPKLRINSFVSVKNAIQDNEISEKLFEDSEYKTYYNFASELGSCLSSIYNTAQYYDNVELIQKKLNDLYKKVMLEPFIPKNTFIIDCFINGSYRYSTKKSFETSKLKSFLSFLKSCSKEKRNVVLSNLHSRFDGISHIEAQLINDDDIPF